MCTKVDAHDESHNRQDHVDLDIAPRQVRLDQRMRRALMSPDGRPQQQHYSHFHYEILPNLCQTAGHIRATMSISTSPTMQALPYHSNPLLTLSQSYKQRLQPNDIS